MWHPYGMSEEDGSSDHENQVREPTENNSVERWPERGTHTSHYAISPHILVRATKLTVSTLTTTIVFTTVCLRFSFLPVTSFQ